MSKQSMYKSMGGAGRGGGGGESSSGTRKQQQQQSAREDGDYETALGLQNKLDEEAGYSAHLRHPRNEVPMHSGSPGGKAAASEKTVSGDAGRYPKEIQDALDEVQKFVAAVMETTCRKCDQALMLDFNVHRWFKRWISTKGQEHPSSICSLTCPNKECQALTCLGCGEKPRMGKFIGRIDGFELDWCCESGRLFALWGFLCEFDDLELAEQEQSRRRVQQSSRQPAHRPSVIEQEEARHRARRALKSPSERQPSYPLPSKKGTGYGSGFMLEDLYPPHFRGRETLYSNPADCKTDPTTKQMLALIIELLPHRSDKSKAAPRALGAMIELSLVQDRIAELLRNDSLQDATTRAGLYFAVLEFFERLGKHPDTSYLIYEERFVKKQSSGLFVISTSKKPKGKGKAPADHHLILGKGEDSTTASLLARMSNIGIQSEALLKASKAVKNEFRTPAAQDLLEVAERIAKLRLSMKPASTADPRKDGSDSKSDKDTTWEEYNRTHCVMREENVLRSLVERLAAPARDLHHPRPNRIKRLVTEASEMETSLPPNIFVKVDEVRPDVMKCLIVGPEGTPYEAGLFEFDFLCPLDYPQSPPAVIFRNTAGGKISFNPNLHPDGVVCLSLLGTFSGPPESEWQGAKSSILSVLVSIQAMIFCPEPMENVPAGWEKVFKDRAGVRGSQSYNSLVQAWTVRFAMLDWLQNYGMRNGIWHDVVSSYFERNGGAVLRVVNRWKGKNRLIGSFENRDLELELANALQAFKQSRR